MAKTAAKGAVPKPPKSAAETRAILAALATQHPNADTELHFTTPYDLLVATILSAQCTDERVNQVTPALFRRYPDARALAKATTGDLEPQIQSTGFFRAKSRSLLGMATAVVEHHGGEVPRTMEALIALPGVGRKTANVVLGHALGIPGLPVDRHVLRVAGRIGLATSEDPEIVEQQLGSALPPADWTRASDTLILHGRRICKPKPRCPDCVVRPECLYYRTVVSKFGKARGTGRGTGIPAPQRSESGSLVEKRQAPQTRGTSRRTGIPVPQRSESGPLVEKRQAPKGRGTRPGSGPPVPQRSESGLPAEKRRTPKARGTSPGTGIPAPHRSESGSLVEKRRAAKPRGTGRGGGAPRQTE